MNKDFIIKDAWIPAMQVRLDELLAQGMGFRDAVKQVFAEAEAGRFGG